MPIIQMSIEAFIDQSYVRDVQQEITTRAEHNAALIEENKKQQAASFHSIMANMRGAYLVMTGMSRVLGGGMTMMFRTMYTMGTSLIATYTTVAAALEGIPGAQIQATLALAGLAFASAQLTGVITKNQELTQNMRGIYMALHGISGMMGSMWYLQ